MREAGSVWLFHDSLFPEFLPLFRSRLRNDNYNRALTTTTLPHGQRGLRWSERGPWWQLLFHRSYYVNFPSPIADAVGMQKGEELEWNVEDRNTFIIKRVKPAKSFLKKKSLA